MIIFLGVINNTFPLLLRNIESSKERAIELDFKTANMNQQILLHLYVKRKFSAVHAASLWNFG